MTSQDTNSQSTGLQKTGLQETGPQGAGLQKPINVDEYQAAARERMSKMAYDYYASGAWDEITLRNNRDAFARTSLTYRVLRDISSPDLSTTVLGRKISMPLMIAPTAFHRLAHDEGELATSRAAAAAGIPYCLSTLATRSIEDVAEVCDGPRWFQLYVYKDRGATAALVQRAVDAGYEALALTVDAQVWAHREADVRNRFHLPDGMKAENLSAAGKGALPQMPEGSGLGAYVQSLFDPSLSWKDLEWLTNLTDLPVVIKGVVHPDDAVAAAEHGAAGVVVSNHGGRQVDTAPATFEVLPRIVDAVDGKIEVLMDGGIRRGSDIVKAVACGARAVGIGRAALWGLAVDGQAGVEHVIHILRDEFQKVMTLCGCRTVDEISRDLIAPGGATLFD